MPATQVLQASHTFTDAEVKTLPTTQHEIIPAAGAGNIIFPFYSIVRLQWVADYTNIDAAAQLKFTVGGASNVLFPFRQDIASSVSGILAGGGPDGSMGWTPAVFQGSVAAAPGALLATGTSGYYDSDLVNFPLVFTADNGAAGNFTGGDAGNSLRVQVIYIILSI